jgi:flagellar assembly protein FliH
LSDETKRGDGADMIWQEFEVDYPHPPNEPENRGEETFIPMENGPGENYDFIPLWNPEAMDQRRAEAEERKAEDMIQQAQERIALLEQEAYEKGFEQGERDGRDLGEKKAGKLLNHFENLLLELANMKKALLEQYEKEILELVFAIAKKIIHQKIENEEHVIEHSVMRALTMATDKSQVDLRINPDDLETIERLKPELVVRFNEIKSIVVTSDPSVTRGGCLVETPYGDVDASIEIQLEKIYTCLNSTYGKDQNDSPEPHTLEQLPKGG